MIKMPSSVSQTFDEQEDFETAFRAEGCHGLVVTGRGQFRAQLTQIALHFLRLSAAEEQLARVAFMAVPGDMVLLTFPIGSEALPICGGLGAQAGEIMTISPGEQVHARTDGLSRWGAIMLPVIELIQYASALTGAPFTVPLAVQCWRPPRAAGRQLRRLHGAASGMAVKRPKILLNAKAARGLAQQLIHTIVECLVLGSTNTATPSGRRHQDIMVGFERLLQAQPDRDMCMTEICAALDVSERRLRNLCAEHLGMGPIGYDRLRRMSLVRSIFLWRDRDTASVSEVARLYGFRQAGRFSANYRALFGETPSATLRRRAGSRQWSRRSQQKRHRR
jgi:AraC-like DNA-binding protein